MASSDFRKRLKQTIRAARRAGWSVSVNGHVKFRGPAGQTVCCSWSPSCPFAHDKILRDLKRAGLDLSSV